MRNRRKPCNHSLHEVEVSEENTIPSTVAGVQMNSPPDVAQIFHLPSTPFRNNMLWGTQPCYFRVLHTIAFFMRYTTLLFQSHICRCRSYSVIHNPVVSGFYIPDTGIFSSPKVPVSSLT